MFYWVIARRELRHIRSMVCMAVEEDSFDEAFGEFFNRIGVGYDGMGEDWIVEAHEVSATKYAHLQTCYARDQL